MTIDAAVVLLSLATAALLYLTYMDWRYFLLPDKGNLVLGILGLAYQAFQTDWTNGTSIKLTLLQLILGALCGAGIFLFTRWFSLKWKGVEGVGLGDVKFSAAAGIWLGPSGVGLMIGGSAALLLAIGGLIILITRRPLKDFYLPFGAAACPVTLFLLWAGWAGWINL
jgi:leader peptidase (prepilin peptidase)/N-methyltransferase